MTITERPPSTGFRHISEAKNFDSRPQPLRSPDMDTGGVMTKHGWFSGEDIGKAGGRLVPDGNGNRVVQFPTWTNERGRHFRAIPEEKLVEGEAMHPEEAP